MGAPLVFDVWADDGPPAPRTPFTSGARVREARTSRLVLAVLLGAAGGVGGLSAVDHSVGASAPTEARSDVPRVQPVSPDRTPVPQRLGRSDFCHPGPRC